MQPRSATVVGAGVMGSGIAQSLATAGYRTVCHDISADQLNRAQASIQSGRYGLDRGVERGKISADQASAALASLSFTTDLEEAVHGAGYVIETVPEDIGLKIDLFRKLDRMAPAGTILSSNTSGYPIAALAAATDRPESVIGWHWASPPPVRPFCEIAVTNWTAEETVAVTRGMALDCGKNPVVVKENDQVWGLVANRIIMSMLREAKKIVDEGLTTPEGVDQLMVDGWAWPVGPFAMLDGAAQGWGDRKEGSSSTSIRV